MVNGEKVTASKRFTAESSDGTVDVIFTFAADDMQERASWYLKSCLMQMVKLLRIIPI